ncbi:hypothetical protein [Mycolicibacterium smegmatis]|uniref:hypothetical protein n=1 Tax=Mycolicibacterium smegmatis TaxID=1772 RepID=UPI000565E750|nr:hypothetical protein [Mycolicibacterium smegmatis]
MDRFEQDLAMAVISWLPYGGIPDDVVLVEFGLSKSQLLERMTTIADALCDRPDWSCVDCARIRRAAEALGLQASSAIRPRMLALSGVIEVADDETAGALGTGRWRGHRGVFTWIPAEGDGQAEGPDARERR